MTLAYCHRSLVTAPSSSPAVSQAQLEKEFLEALNQQAARLRSSMQMEMTMESQVPRVSTGT